MGAVTDAILNALVISACATGFYSARRAIANIDFAPVAAVVISAYLVGIALSAACLLIVLACGVMAAIVSATLYCFVQRYLERGFLSGPLSFVAGLGLLSAAQGLVSVLFGAGEVAFCRQAAPAGVFGQRASVAFLAFAAALAWAFLMERTLLGARIRAAGDNPRLLVVCGDVLSVWRALGYAGSGFLIGIAVACVAADSHLTTDRVVTVALDGLIGSLLGGTRSAWHAVLGGLIWGFLFDFLRYVTPESFARPLGLLLTAQVLAWKGPQAGLLDFETIRRPG